MTDGLQAKIGITTFVPKLSPEEGEVPPDNPPADNPGTTTAQLQPSSPPAQPDPPESSTRWAWPSLASTSTISKSN